MSVRTELRPRARAARAEARGVASRLPAAVLGLAVLAVLAGCEAASDATGPGADPMVRVGPDVAAALAASGGVRVVVALRLDELAGSADGAGAAGAAGGAGAADGRVPGVPDVPVLERRVRWIGDAFLDRSGRDLSGVKRFSTVAAVVGTVSSEASLARLAADPAVARIDLDVGGTGGLASSVPHIGADGRHRRGNDGAGVVIAILDTGVQRGHPALGGRVVAEACFGGPTGFCPNGTSRQTGAGAAEDDAGHGTHVAGILASSGSVGSPGVAPAASLVSVKVTDDCSFSGCFDAFSEIVAALDYLIVNHEALQVRVVNMSLGTNALFDGVCDQSTAYNMAGAQAARTLRDLGVVVVAAAMNDGTKTRMASPACLSDVVGVGATDNDDRLTSFTNISSETALVAPGVGILSLARGGGTLTASGTSMATPHVAGCAALLAQAGPGLTADALIDRLRTSPVTVSVPTTGALLPRLDCRPDLSAPDPEVTVTVDRPAAP